MDKSETLKPKRDVHAHITFCWLLFIYIHDKLNLTQTIKIVEYMYSLCQKKPTTHSELGFRDPPGRGGLTVDMVNSLYGDFKETHCFGF